MLPTGLQLLIHVSESTKEKILYFASNREGTVGGMDIWYSEVRNKGAEYTAPQNCGRKINTMGDEITPFTAKGRSAVFQLKWPDQCRWIGYLSCNRWTEKLEKPNECWISY